jgi:hypothetical protein
MARSGCIYAESGCFKSTAGKHFSHYIYEKVRKKTLLVSLDGGGWGPMQPEVDAGIINAYRCGMEVPLPTLRNISKGKWPIDPTQTRANATDLHDVDWNEYGGMIVEGISSISQALMRHLADNQIKTGEEATSPFSQRVLVDGVVKTETFAGNSKAHYGFVQNQMYSLITNFTSLPCEYVLFTALPSRAEDDDRTPIYGPQVAGKKATALVPSWVGDCIHGEGTAVRKTVTVPNPADPKQKIETEIVDTVVRMYFIKHPDPVTGIMFPCKPRVSPEVIPELMKRFPGGYFEPTLEHGFDDYLKTVDELNAHQKGQVDEWRRKVDEKWGRGTGQAAGNGKVGEQAREPVREPAKEAVAASAK